VRFFASKVDRIRSAGASTNFHDKTAKVSATTNVAIVLIRLSHPLGGLSHLKAEIASELLAYAAARVE
jgi:hypothetical protein